MRFFEGALAIAIILTPWFYLRYGGFDFSIGTSFTLGDFFLSLAMVIPMTQFLFKSFPSNNYVRLTTFTVLAFLLLTIPSAVIAALGFFPLTQFDFSVFFSVFVQYGYCMIGFVLLGLRATCAKRIVTLVGVGYLTPMVVSVILAMTGQMSSENSWFFSVNRAIGSYGNANSFAAVILIVFPLYMQLTAEGESYFEKKIGIAGLLCSAVCLFMTVSFSAWLVLAVILILNFAYLLLSSKHPLRHYRFRAVGWLLFITSIAPLVIMALLKSFPEILEAVSYRLLLDRDEDVSMETVGSGAERIELMHIAAGELIKRSIVGIFFGHGLGQSLFFPNFNFDGVVVVVHNLPLLISLESGLIATILFYLYFLFLVAAIWRTRRDHPLLALTLLNSVLLFLCYTLFNPHFYLRYFWVPLLPAFVLACNYKKRS